MNRTSRIALATFMFALGLAAFPHHATASTTTTVTTQTQIKGDSTDDKHKDWVEVLASVLSLLA